jgi:hypothetical protein
MSEVLIYIMLGFTPFPGYHQVRVKGVIEHGEGHSVGKECQRPVGWRETDKNDGFAIF